MTAQTANKVTVPVGSDGWNLTTHIKNAFESADIIVPVYTKTERDALDKYDGLTVRRMDIIGRPTETYDTSAVKWTATDVPWTEITLSDEFSHALSPGWAGAKYAVRNGWVIIDGAVTRGTPWSADQKIATLPASVAPGVKIQGSGVQVNTNGTVYIPAGSIAASFSATWPLF